MVWDVAYAVFEMSGLVADIKKGLYVNLVCMAKKKQA